MACIWLFVGSTRSDAAQQMRILLGLIVVFGAGTVASAVAIWRVRRSAVSFRGASVAFTGSDGRQTRALADVERLERSPFGQVVVCFAGGATLRLDPHASGAPELIERIADLLGHGEGDGPG